MGKWVPKIVDFGIVATRELSQHTQTGSLLLTPSYAAPEQWLGTRAAELDGRTDFMHWVACSLRSLPAKSLRCRKLPRLGSDAYELRSRTPSTLRPDLAKWRGLDAFVLRLLAKERNTGLKTMPNCSYSLIE